MRRGVLRDVVVGLLVAGTLLVIGGEFVVRVFGHTLVYEPDPVLGWRPKAGLTATFDVQDAAGERHAVEHVTVQHGFRVFGDSASSRPRVLFVGDSFTADPATSRADAYFGVATRELPVEAFAIGGGGYGTLQELLLVEPLLALVQPDVLVLQYCTNDLEDNNFDAESRLSHVRNMKNLRPYQVGDDMVYRMSPQHPYRLLHEHSRLFRKIDVEVMKLQYRLRDPARFRLTADERVRSAEITTRLMSRLAAAVPAATRKLSISCNTGDGDERALWQAMARQSGFEPLPSVSEAVEAAERAGSMVRLQDGFHWNRLGHRLAGEELQRRLVALLR